MDDVTREIQQEREEAERERNRPPKITNDPVKRARYVWIGGTMLIDALTAWIIWQLTSLWYYAVIWVIAGAGGLLYSEDLKTRVGNNPEQQEYANRGVWVSAGAVFLMALFIGAMFVTRFEATWIDAVLELTSVGLFFFHLYQSYQYHNLDDEVQARNEEARAEERTRKKEREIHRAARLVERKQKQHSLKDNYRQQYGPAFDVALNNGKTEKTNNRPPMQQTMRAYAADDENPTSPSPR